MRENFVMKLQDPLNPLYELENLLQAEKAAK